MRENGSPEPFFEFDQGRSYFRVVLPAHPQYLVIHALREAAHLWATGERNRAIQHLENAVQQNPRSGALVFQLLTYAIDNSNWQEIENWAKKMETNPDMFDSHHPYLVLSGYFIDRQDPQRATAILSKMPSPVRAEDAVELAILYKRAGKYSNAHKVFAANFDLLKDKSKAIHEFAQTKQKLAGAIANKDKITAQRLNKEAVELLRQALPLAENATRLAWLHFDLAKALSWLKMPDAEIEKNYRKAIELMPAEPRFQDGFREWTTRRNKANANRGGKIV